MSSRPQVAIVDYSLGNLFSVVQACELAGLSPIVTSEPQSILKSDGVILPGVGAFGDAMDSLARLGLDAALKEFVSSGKPFLGICLGLQLLASESEEFGITQGLGLVGGKVRKFPRQKERERELKVPQIAWNSVRPPKGQPDRWQGTPLDGVSESTYFYFVHSFYLSEVSPEHVLCSTSYGGITYCSGLHKDNLVAFQFHPEKSGRDGIRVYENWRNRSFR